MNKLVYSALALTVFFSASCTLNQEETDGRKYYTNSSPLQGKMGVTFKRVATTRPEATPGEAPGLLDRNEKPDEPGAEYWLHGQQSPSPIQGKMGVQVTRRKK